MKQAAGFSLIELMIAVAVAGILATIALPSYRIYVIRGRIPEATGNLAIKQVQMEQYFQDNRTYVGGPACNNDATTSKYFSFSCTGVSATAYTLTATGTSGMAGFGYTLDQTNIRRTTAVPTGWSLPATNCWVTNKGGSC